MVYHDFDNCKIPVPRCSGACNAPWWQLGSILRRPVLTDVIATTMGYHTKSAEHCQNNFSGNWQWPVYCWHERVCASEQRFLLLWSCQPPPWLLVSWVPLCEDIVCYDACLLIDIAKCFHHFLTNVPFLTNATFSSFCLFVGTLMFLTAQATPGLERETLQWRPMAMRSMARRSLGFPRFLFRLLHGLRSRLSLITDECRNGQECDEPPQPPL